MNQDTSTTCPGLDDVSTRHFRLQYSAFDKLFSMPLVHAWDWLLWQDPLQGFCHAAKESANSNSGHWNKNRFKTTTGQFIVGICCLIHQFEEYGSLTRGAQELCHEISIAAYLFKIGQQFMAKMNLKLLVFRSPPRLIPLRNSAASICVWSSTSTWPGLLSPTCIKASLQKLHLVALTTPPPWYRNLFGYPITIVPVPNLE